MVLNLGVVAVTAMVLISVLVVAPLFLEVFFTILNGLGFPQTRTRLAFLRVTKYAHMASDKAEVGVMLSVVAMILTAIYIHFTEFLHHEHPVHLVLWHVSPSLYINGNMLYHLYKAVTVSPGTPSPGLDRRDGGRPCDKCNVFRAVGTHHCSTCNRCSLEMDHHCPFTANCVGKRNYPFFFAFVLWSWIATIYAMWLVYHPFSHCYHIEDVTSLDEQHFCKTWQGMKKRIFLVALAAFGVLSGFLAFVVYLLVTGQTTRAFLSKGDSSQQFGHTAWERVQYRLGPARAWGRYLLPWGPSGILLPQGSG